MQPAEHLAEGVMGRNTPGQFQEGLEPGEFPRPILGHIHPAFGSAQHRKQRDGEDIQKLVNAVALRISLPEARFTCYCVGFVLS